MFVVGLFALAGSSLVAPTMRKCEWPRKLPSSVRVEVGHKGDLVSH